MHERVVDLCLTMPRNWDNSLREDGHHTARPSSLTNISMIWPLLPDPCPDVGAPVGVDADPVISVVIAFPATGLVTLTGVRWMPAARWLTQQVPSDGDRAQEDDQRGERDKSNP